MKIFLTILGAVTLIVLIPVGLFMRSGYPHIKNLLDRTDLPDELGTTSSTPQDKLTTWDQLPINSDDSSDEESLELLSNQETVDNLDYSEEQLIRFIDDNNIETETLLLNEAVKSVTNSLVQEINEDIQHDETWDEIASTLYSHVENTCLIDFNKLLETPDTKVFLDTITDITQNPIQHINALDTLVTTLTDPTGPGPLLPLLPAILRYCLLLKGVDTRSLLLEYAQTRLNLSIRGFHDVLGFFRLLIQDEIFCKSQGTEGVITVHSATVNILRKAEAALFKKDKIILEAQHKSYKLQNYHGLVTWLESIVNETSLLRNYFRPLICSNKKPILSDMTKFILLYRVYSEQNNNQTLGDPLFYKYGALSCPSHSTKFIRSLLEIRNKKLNETDTQLKALLLLRDLTNSLYAIENKFSYFDEARFLHIQGILKKHTISNLKKSVIDSFFVPTLPHHSVLEEIGRCSLNHKDAIIYWKRISTIDDVFTAKSIAEAIPTIESRVNQRLRKIKKNK